MDLWWLEVSGLMGTPTTLYPRLAASTRLVLAMFRIIAGIEDGFGKAVLDILRKQYPDQDISGPDADPAGIGHKLMAVARKQNQGDPQRAMDAIQDLLSYLTGAGKAREREVEVEVDDPRSPTGKRVDTKTTYERGKEWDFATDTADNWREALKNIYSNLRLRGMSKSMEHMKRKKQERSVDDAFGARGEGGEAPSGGEARMPTPADNPLARALDDQAAIKSFVDLIDQKVPELRASLSDDARKLFDLIFFDEEGSFGSDVKENMGQASALKEKHPDLFEAHAKRWSGFVGDLRRKLLEEIWDFVDEGLDPDERDTLRDTFFDDASPKDVRKLERKKVQDKLDYQQGIDERKLSKWKWREQNGALDPKDAKPYKNLEKKLRDQGVDVDSIPALEDPDDKGWELHSRAASARASALEIAVRIAAGWV